MTHVSEMAADPTKKAFFFLWFSLGVLVSSLIIAGYLYITAPEDVPNPYHDVELVQMHYSGNDLHLDINFVKNDKCVFEDLRTFIKGDKGEWTVHPYYDNTSHFKGIRTGDRYGGGQTAYIGIPDVKQDLEHSDRFELRTRHSCLVGDKSVKKDAIFFEFNPQITTIPVLPEHNPDTK